MLWLVASFCAGLFALAWWLSRPVGWVWRWLFRLAVLVMLLALASPPHVIDWLRDALSWLLPLAREASDVPGASFVVHFVLFAAVSGLLFWIRSDLGRLRPLLGMAALAFLLEGVQLLVDGRYADWADVVVNLAGVGLAAVVVWPLRAAVQRHAGRDLLGSDSWR